MRSKKYNSCKDMWRSIHGNRLPDLSTVSLVNVHPSTQWKNREINVY